MKQKVVIMTVALTIGLGYLLVKSNAHLDNVYSDVTMANIEALTNSEVVGPNDRFGYVLRECYKMVELDGTKYPMLSGKRCDNSASPYDICNAGFAWGDCGY